MIKRTLLIVLLGISLTALIGNEASARVCAMRSTTGACLVWTGSVECGIGATGVGNVANDCVILQCTVDSSCPPDNPNCNCPPNYPNCNAWAVACANPGSNEWTAPGINLAYFSGTLVGTYALEKKDVDRNGRAYVSIFAAPNNDFLQALVNAGACPNYNWTAIDAAPCSMTVIDQEYVNGCLTSEAKYLCALPNCETLAWDLVDQKFERRQYECTQTSRTEFKCP